MVLLIGSPLSTKISKPFQTMHQHSPPVEYTTEDIWLPLLKLKKQKEQSGKPMQCYVPFGDWENCLSIAAFNKFHIADFGQ